MKNDELEPDFAQNTLTIIGIGASASSSNEIKNVLKGITLSSNTTLVCMLHYDLDGVNELSLKKQFERTTSLPVVIIKNNQKIKAKQIYIAPKGYLVSIFAGKFACQKAGSHLSENQISIDTFFFSLAKDKNIKSIGIILSGHSLDGSQGIQSIHSEASGVTFAQDQVSAKHTIMPTSAIATGCVDYVLSPKKIAEEISRIVKHPMVSLDLNKKPFLQIDDKEAINKILRLVSSKNGVDFTKYKLSTIKRRIQRRVFLHKLDDLDSYFNFLHKHPVEVEALQNDLLIKVTGFFRSPSSFDILVKKVLPKLLGNRPPNDPIRIWVPACSTGEEAYSLAIALQEYKEETNSSIQIQIFATDICEKAIEKARSGAFSHSISNEVSEKRLCRFFDTLEGGYKVKKHIREMCIFAIQNIICDPPFSKVDLISCRNLLIYFSSSLQRKVIPTLHYALKSGGFLLLGTSESLSGYDNLFSIVDSKHSFYSKKNTKKRSFFEPSLNLSGKQLKSSNPFNTKKNEVLNSEYDIGLLGDNFVLANYGPAGFIVDENFQIIQVRGDTTGYIELSPGYPNMSLQKLVRKELKTTLRSMLIRAQNSKNIVTRDNIRINNKSKSIRVDVAPLEKEGMSGQYYIILFHENNCQDYENLAADASASDISSHVLASYENEIEKLQTELMEAREYLQTVIEEQESTTEELKSSNEEILSSNEELQSTNEELQTAKEEVDSANEELKTLNDELVSRNEEVLRANDDMNNLIEGARIPVVIVDENLRIRRFTPEAEKLFSLIKSDIGRPLPDIRSKIKNGDLESKIKEVVSSLQTYSADIKNEFDHWYKMQIRPFRTSDNKIEGAVLTFLDIHAMKKGLEQAQRLANVVNSSHDAIILYEFDGKICDWNRGAELMYGYSKNDALKMSIFDITPEASIKNIRDNISKLSKGKQTSSYETTRITKNGKLLDIWLTTTILRDEEGAPKEIASIERDITDKKRIAKLQLEKKESDMARAAKGQFLAIISHELRTPLSAIIGFSDLLVSSDVSEEEKRDFASRILRNGKNLKNLVDDILDLSKIEAGKLNIEKIEFSLLEELSGLLDTFKSQASSKGLLLDFSIKGKFPMAVVSDPTRIVQIVSNIVGNAVKFTSKGKIKVEAEVIKRKNYSGKYLLEVKVKDTGCGISKENQNKLFLPFTQVSDSIARLYGGTGLGLELSRKLANALGGNVLLVDSKLGEGSVFLIQILLDKVVYSNKNQNEQNHTPDMSQENWEELYKSNCNGARILIVEDNEELSFVLSKFLELNNAITIPVSSGEEALKKVFSEDYDLIFMDIELPKVSGLEILKQIRNKGLKVPVVAISARSTKKDSEILLQSGCDEYISKPFVFKQIANVLEKYILK